MSLLDLPPAPPLPQLDEITVHGWSVLAVYHREDRSRLGTVALAMRRPAPSGTVLALTTWTVFVWEAADNIRATAFLDEKAARQCFGEHAPPGAPRMA